MSELQTAPPPPVIERPRVSIGRIILLIAGGLMVAFVIFGHIWAVPWLLGDFKERGTSLPAVTRLLLDIRGWTAVFVCWNAVAIFLLLVVLEVYSRRDRLKVILGSIFLALLFLYSLIGFLSLYLPWRNMMNVR